MDNWLHLSTSFPTISSLQLTFYSASKSNFVKCKYLVPFPPDEPINDFSIADRKMHKFSLIWTLVIFQIICPYVPSHLSPSISYCSCKPTSALLPLGLCIPSWILFLQILTFQNPSHILKVFTQALPDNIRQKSIFPSEF